MSRSVTPSPLNDALARDVASGRQRPIRSPRICPPSPANSPLVAQATSHVEGRRGVHALGGRTLVVWGDVFPLRLPSKPEANTCRSPGMFLAGLPVRDDLILELARLADDDTLAERLEAAYGQDVKVLALDIAERETIIRALEDRRPASRSSGSAARRIRRPSPRRAHLRALEPH